MFEIVLPFGKMAETCFGYDTVLSRKVFTCITVYHKCKNNCGSSTKNLYIASFSCLELISLFLVSTNLKRRYFQVLMRLEATWRLMLVSHRFEGCRVQLLWYAIFFNNLKKVLLSIYAIAMQYSSHVFFSNSIKLTSTYAWLSR